MSHGFATMSVASILAETAHRKPGNVALIFGPQQITYGDLWEQTRGYAGALRSRGIGEGDAVALLIPNVPDFRGRTTRSSRWAPWSCPCTPC